MFTSDEIHKINSDRLAKVLPELQTKCLQIISIAAAAGFVLLVTQGLRTVAEQNALYAQGRTAPGKIVTNARGSQSNHTTGKAVDFAFVVNGEISWDENLYQKLGAWAATVGLHWGGNWKTIKDKPHVEI